jgi:uncharacterized protein
VKNHLKYIVIVGLLSAGIPLITPVMPLPTLAIPIEQVQNPRLSGNRSWVTDQANRLSPNAENVINDKLAQLERDTGVEVAVVTIPNLAPEPTIESYANKLFNRWGIGKRGLNNGILFLWAPGDRKVRIEVGTGLQGKIPNAFAQSILNSRTIPQLKQGTPQADEQAVQQTVDAITQAVRAEPVPTPAKPASGFSGQAIGGFIAIVCILYFLIVSPMLRFFRRLSGRNGRSRSYSYYDSSRYDNDGDSYSDGSSDSSDFGGGSSDGGGSRGDY